MSHAPARLVRKADRRAERRCRKMLAAQTYNDPLHPTTLLWHEAERLLRVLRGEPEPRWIWEAAEWRATSLGGEYADAAISLPDVPLADPGDHFRYPS